MVRASKTSDLQRLAQAIEGATRAKVLLDLLSEYSSSEMHEAMTRLKKTSKELKDIGGIEKHYKDKLEAGDSAAVEPINAERRTVSKFYRAMYVMWKAKAISKKELAIAFSRDLFDFYLEVIAPIDRVHREVEGLPAEQNLKNFITDVRTSCVE